MSLNPLLTPPQDLSGHIIMASPSLKGGVFESACILITQHDENGAEGFILNHCSDMTVEKVLNHAEGNLAELPLHFGGPVETGSVNFLIVGNSKKSGLMFRANASKEEAEKASKSSNARVIACLGYASWGKDQLEQEFEHQTWFYRKAPAEIVNHDFGLDLWKNMMSTHSPFHRFIAGAAVDLTLN